MKIKSTYVFIMLALLATIQQVAAQGTAFTYQGRLNDGVNPANGTYDLHFTVFDNATGASQQGPALTNSATTISNGLFTVTLDFGNQFPGANRWLEIGVRTNGGGSFFMLSPRQAITPAPYAIMAGGVVSGGLGAGTYGNAVTFNNANNSFSGAFTGNGANMLNVNATALNGLGAASFWQSGGNNVSAGQFLGSKNNQPVEIQVNGQRAMRMEFGGASAAMSIDGYTNLTGAPNIVGGSPANFIASGVVGSVIAGGGATNYYDIGLFTNSISAFSDFSVISGGLHNTASNNYATVGGGYQSTASGQSSTVGGGYQNTASGDSSTVAGGDGNTASGSWSTVPGGYENIAEGAGSFAAGAAAEALDDFSFVWADGSAPSFASTGENQFDVLATGGINLAGDVSLSGGAAAYHHLSLSGGNSIGYLYGSYPALGDGIHLGYNYYYDNSGAGHVINTGGATSRISAKYGEIVLAVGGINASPNTVRVDATTAGVTVYGTFNNSSDRNVKQDFSAVSPTELLAKVLQLPISEWSYKTDAATRHIGPMGQDFYSVFNIGTDEKHIAPIDEGGVALAAIQGLNQKLEQTCAENIKLKQENDSLGERLDELEATVKQLAARK